MSSTRFSQLLGEGPKENLIWTLGKKVFEKNTFLQNTLGHLNQDFFQERTVPLENKLGSSRNLFTTQRQVGLQDERLVYVLSFAFHFRMHFKITVYS